MAAIGPQTGWSCHGACGSRNNQLTLQAVYRIFLRQEVSPAGVGDGRKCRILAKPLRPSRKRQPKGTKTDRAEGVSGGTPP